MLGLVLLRLPLASAWEFSLQSNAAMLKSGGTSHPARGHRADTLGSGTGGTRACMEELPPEEDEELSPRYHVQLGPADAPTLLKHFKTWCSTGNKTNPKNRVFSMEATAAKVLR